MSVRVLEKFVEANGIRFAYLEEGEGPLVLLVHGFPDTAHSFDASRTALAAAGFRAVTPFTRGYHPTSIPKDGKYDAETLGRDLVELIPALGAEHAIVVGHDWGASASYTAAALAPQRVKMLVTVAIPHPMALRPSLRLLWGARHMLRFQLRSSDELLRKHNFALVDELVHRWSPTWNFSPTENSDVKECFRHPGVVEAALGYYRAIRPQPLAIFKTPLAMSGAAFCGSDDPVLSRKYYEYARRYYASTYEIIEMPGGHFLHREYPQRFNDELLRVLRAAS